MFDSRKLYFHGKKALQGLSPFNKYHMEHNNFRINNKTSRIQIKILYYLLCSILKEEKKNLCIIEHGVRVN